MKRSPVLLCDCCCDCVALTGYECDCEDLCFYWERSS